MYAQLVVPKSKDSSASMVVTPPETAGKITCTCSILILSFTFEVGGCGLSMVWRAQGEPATPGQGRVNYPQEVEGWSKVSTIFCTLDPYSTNYQRQCFEGCPIQ